MEGFMRLPWIQLAADGVRRGRMGGVLMGIGEHAGVGFVAAIWSAALELAADGDFSGAVEDPGVLVAGAGGVPPGCPADAGGVVLILQRVGLVATHPKLRVRGLDRYRSAWLKNRKRHDHPPGLPPEPPANPERKTETKTEIKKEASAPPEASPPKKPSAQQAFFEWAQAEAKAKVSGRLPEGAKAARVNAQLKPYITDIGRTGLEAAWKAYMCDEYALKAGLPWGLFVSKIPELHNRSQTRPAKPATKFIEPGKDLYADPAP